MTKNQIIAHLPYTKPFHFVDALSIITEDGAKGQYTFARDSDFYKGHFKNAPVTPGVILTECCAQIGLVCLGIYLMNGSDASLKGLQIGMSSSEMEFLLPVFPGETVTVASEKVYFRFNKLKCKVKMYNDRSELVCRGVLSGMLKVNANG